MDRTFLLMMMMIMILIYIQGTAKFQPPKGYRDVLSLRFIYKVLFLEEPKTTRGKRASLQTVPGP